MDTWLIVVISLLVILMISAVTYYIRYILNERKVKRRVALAKIAEMNKVQDQLQALNEPFLPKRPSSIGVPRRAGRSRTAALRRLEVLHEI